MAKLLRPFDFSALFLIKLFHALFAHPAELKKAEQETEWDAVYDSRDEMREGLTLDTMALKIAGFLFSIALVGVLLFTMIPMDSDDDKYYRTRDAQRAARTRAQLRSIRGGRYNAKRKAA